MKKRSHNRRRRPGSPSDAGGHTRPASGESGPLDADQIDRTLAEEALTEKSIGDNDLAEATLAVVEHVRPYFSTILAGLAAALAVLVAFAVVQSQSETTRKQSWDACLAAMSAGDSDSFNEVIRRYPSTDAARWAELLMADAAAAEGTQLLFIDRQRAQGRLQAAVDSYSSLMAGRPQGLLGERVVFGLAKARESLGQLEEARRGYEAVAAEFPADALAQIASARATELGRESTRQWYDWFGAQNIAPPASATNATNPAPAATPAAPVAEPATPAEPATSATPATEPAQPAAGQ